LLWSVNVNMKISESTGGEDMLTVIVVIIKSESNVGEDLSSSKIVVMI